MSSPSVRLAYFTVKAVDESLSNVYHKDVRFERQAPALLVSYVLVEPFLKLRHKYVYRDWVMDSGAFSAHNSGAVIDLNQYIDTCHRLLSSDKTLTEVFALDVIGNPDASYKNAVEMWRQGVPAIPCYHAGEPEDLLVQLAKEFPKIALGGVAGGIVTPEAKEHFFHQCFARIWPKKVHGFGVSSDAMVLGLPFHSVDATNWEIGPCAFGSWMKFGAMSIRGQCKDLRSQIAHYMELEDKAQAKWTEEMKQLDALTFSPRYKLGQPERGFELSAQTERPSKATKAKPESKPKEQEAEKVATPPQPKPSGMEDKWKDYWRTRFA